MVNLDQTHDTLAGTVENDISYEVEDAERNRGNDFRIDVRKHQKEQKQEPKNRVRYKSEDADLRELDDGIDNNISKQKHQLVYQ